MYAENEECTLTKTPVFIVSTGRCGSQMLTRVLSLHPQVLALHEPHPMLNMEAYLAWSRARDRQEVQRRVAKKRRSLIAQVSDMNGLLYLESSHFMAHLIPALEALFVPRFIHLYRNGRDFVNSGLSRSWYQPVDLREHLASWMRHHLAIDVGNSYLDHRLKPPHHHHSRLEKVAWLWAEINRTILRDLQAVPAERQMRLPLEDFDASMLQRLHEFIGITPRPELIPAMLDLAAARPNASQSPTPLAWGKVEAYRFQRIAGDMMRTLGYAAPQPGELA